MIATMEGIVADINQDHIVLLVNGIGYRIHTAPAFSNSLELHKNQAIFVHLVVREESLTLYGFETSEKRDMFILLLSVTGVGPKSAMALLSSVPINRIKEAVVNENPDLLGKVPGVGKKIAQSIIIHLKGKIRGEFERGNAKISEIDQDVIGALTALGYSLVEAQTAVQGIPKEAPEDLETRITLALRSFG